ncbi:MAG: hypothetical protein Q8N05_07345, partial [Bacteroidota bacterium]|nr:hypothetical protein [Bacteroidota bacterium]
MQMDSIRQIQKILFVGLPITLLGQVTEARFPKKNLNVVVFTADDLGPDGMGVGAFGAKIKGITPNIDKVFTQIDYLSSNKYWPMRCVQDKEYGYIFNPWSDGKAAYHNANEGETFKAMEQEGKTN